MDKNKSFASEEPIGIFAEQDDLAIVRYAKEITRIIFDDPQYINDEFPEIGTVFGKKAPARAFNTKSGMCLLFAPVISENYVTLGTWDKEVFISWTFLNDESFSMAVFLDKIKNNEQPEITINDFDRGFPTLIYTMKEYRDKLNQQVKS